jgi:endonuclease/exonuclease/phosphatase family metal-dependent hydrolase
MMSVMTLRVMTWNLWWHFGPWERRQQAIIEVMRSVDPDIVCIQEVWSDVTHDQADQIGDALGYHVARTAPVLFDGQAFGNAVLSRWKVEVIADQPLPRLDGHDGHRRVLATGVDTPWGTWPIVSTHLDHRFDASAARSMQCQRLLELAAVWRGNADVDLPVIVGGDLNAVADSDEIRLLTGRRASVPGIVFNDAWELTGDGAGPTWRRENPYSVDSAWPDRRLDYLLVSWPRPKPVGNPTRAWIAGAEPINGVWPSDHAAVVAEFVTPESSPA